MKTLKLAAVPLLLAVPFAAQADVIIDLFSTSQDKLTDATTGDGGLSSSVTTAGDDILGGARDIYVELLSNGGVDTREASIGVGGGVLDFSVDTLSTGTGTVQWDGNDGSIALDPTGLGGLDLSGLTNFEVTTLYSDFGYEFLINAYTDGSNWTTISFSAHAVAVGPVVSYIPLAAFSNVALCGTVNPATDVNYITCGSGNTAPVDWSNLGALELVIDPNGGTTSIDLTLDSVRAVPTPGALALLGAGLLGFGAMRRREG